MTLSNKEIHGTALNQKAIPWTQKHYRSITPIRLSFISENQSVDHHSKPFRGRMKGTFMSSAKVLFLSENLAFPFNFQLI